MQAACKYSSQGTLQTAGNQGKRLIRRIQQPQVALGLRCPGPQAQLPRTGGHLLLGQFKGCRHSPPPSVLLITTFLFFKLAEPQHISFAFPSWSRSWLYYVRIYKFLLGRECQPFLFLVHENAAETCAATWVGPAGKPACAHVRACAVPAALAASLTSSCIKPSSCRPARQAPRLAGGSWAACSPSVAVWSPPAGL